MHTEHPASLFSPPWPSASSQVRVRGLAQVHRQRRWWQVQVLVQNLPWGNVRVRKCVLLCA